MNAVLKKIIVCLFIIVSFLMLFCNWIALSYDYKELGFNSKQELENNLSEYLTTEIEDAAYEIEEGLGWYGLDVDMSGIVKVGRAISDLKLTAGELSIVSAEGSKFVSATNSFVDMLADQYGMSEAELKGSEGAFAVLDILGLAFTVYQVLFIVTIVTAGLALLARITGRFEKFDIIYFIMQILMLVYTIVLIGKLNDMLIRLEPGIAAVITAAPIIAVILACPSLILGLVPVKQTAGASRNNGFGRESAGPVNEESWKCPRCGSNNEAAHSFCTMCGLKRPEIIVCPNCGAEIDDIDRFCRVCGMPVDLNIFRKKEDIINEQRMREEAQRAGLGAYGCFGAASGIAGSPKLVNAVGPKFVSGR